MCVCVRVRLCVCFQRAHLRVRDLQSWPPHSSAPPPSPLTLCYIKGQFLQHNFNFRAPAPLNGQTAVCRV